MKRKRVKFGKGLRPAGTALGAVFLAAIAAFAAEAPGFVATADARATELYRALLRPQENFRIVQAPGRDESIAGSASRDPVNEFRVVFDSGFVKTPRLTPDAYRIALCHELGHLFGGFPRRSAPEGWEGPVGEDGNMLLSSEGQADYYSSRACFRRLVAGEDHERALEGKQISSSVRNRCEVAWGKGSENSLVCVRAALGAYDFLRLVFDFKISLEDHDPEVVDRTLETYPSRQCRLDTIVAGALCSVAVPLDLNGRDVADYGCRNEFARPACWFKPQ